VLGVLGLEGHGVGELGLGGGGLSILKCWNALGFEGEGC